MRVVSWNVNGLRACARKGFLEWLAQCEADVVGLQEVRCEPAELPAPLLQPDGWATHFVPAQKKGYSGVGLYVGGALEGHVSRHLPGLGIEAFDVEGRIQQLEIGELLIVNAYFPNGNGRDRDLSRIPYKLDFYERLRRHLEPALAAQRPVLVLGDYNTALEDIDLARPGSNRETSGFRPEEREALRAWLAAGWVDTFRHFHPGQGGHYSWWSNRPGVRERNIGWRIDYILASPAAMAHVRAAAIHPGVLGSDHCPVSVDLDLAILG